MPSKKELLDLQFIDARHKLIDLAAFLDRIDRHAGDADYRFAALKAALPILLEARPDRARAVQRPGELQRPDPWKSPEALHFKVPSGPLYQ